MSGISTRKRTKRRVGGRKSHKSRKKRKTKRKYKTKKRRGGAANEWLDYKSFHNLVNNNTVKPEDIVLVRPKGSQGNGEEEKFVSDESSDGDYDFSFVDQDSGFVVYYECCIEGDNEEVEFKLKGASEAPQSGGGKKKKIRRRRRNKKKKRGNTKR
ncbi:hypothetical protein N9S60_00220 [bacterium]|nr:hypothetical protein [bacterium]